MRYAQQHPALRGKVEPWLQVIPPGPSFDTQDANQRINWQARLHEAERHYGDRELFDPAQFAREGAG